MTQPSTASIQPRVEGTYDERVRAAALEWAARRTGASSPIGTYTPKGNWYPDDRVERQPCCRTHKPRPTYPQAVKKHCLGVEHVANLFGVSVRDVRAHARKP